MPQLPPIEADGRAYSLSIGTHSGVRRVLLCEAPVDSPLPRYPLRRHLRARLHALHASPLIVFTDAARSAEVWCRTTGSPGEPRSVRERVRLASEMDGAPPRWLRELGVRGANPRFLLPPGPDHPASSLPLALLRLADRRLPLLMRRGGIVWRLLRDDPTRYGALDVEAVAPAQGAARPVPGLELRQLLHDVVEHPSGPPAVGAVWRALLALRVLDAGCAAGDWLLDAMMVLEPLYLATLEQMRVWLAEEALARRARRSGLLRDFETALGAAGSSAAAFAREAIVLCNLHGLDRDPTVLARCRRRLASRLRARDVPAGRLPAAALRLEVGWSDGGIASRAELARALVGSADAGARLRALGEEAESLGRAERLLRRARLAERMGAASLVAGLRLLGERKRALARELDAVAGAGGSLHPFAAWNDVAGCGGFHVVRGGER